MCTPRSPLRGRRSGRVRSLSAGVLALVLGGLCGCEPSLGAGAIDIRAAQRIEVASAAADATPPDATAFADAPLVALPDAWSMELRTHATRGWYRAVVTLPATPRERWAIYLPRVIMNAAVWINGEPVGSGGRMAPAIARNWNRPLLLSIPGGVLHAGANVVDVELGVQPTYPGLLAAFSVGPDDALRPAYEWRLSWQITATQISVLLTAYWGLAGVLLWFLLRRDSPGLGWTAFGCILWSLAMLEPIVRYPVIPVLAWQWLVSSALVGSVGCFALGARRFLRIGRAGLDRAVLTIWALGALALALALADGSPRLVQLVVVVWAAASLGVAVYLMRLLIVIRTSLRAIEGEAVRYLAPLAAIALAFGVHDLTVASGLRVPPSIMLMPYVGSIIALWGGVRVVERLASALAESEALNRDLERRVAERGAELARNYEQIRSLERGRLLQSERERMMRDIHDGMGAQLTSTLALVESERVSPDEVADALRDALDDMRLLIAPLGPTADDLLTLLATWRARIERRLERRGLAFDWQVVDLPPLPWLRSREALDVLRIFQEAVTNIVKHANATTITVRTGPRAGASGAAGVFVEIADDGRGLAAAAGASDGVVPRRASFGLGNMAVRAAELGGTIDVGPGDRGARVVLWLPLERTAAVEEPRP